MDLTSSIKIFVGLLSIVNPLGSVPIFLSLSAGWDNADRNRCARVAALAVAIILTLAAWTGNMILQFFGISIDSFRIGGGILILLMAISMLHAKTSHMKHTPDEAEEAADKEDISVVPLAVPLLAGPGAISTVILYLNEIRFGPGAAHYARLFEVELVIVLVSLISWLLLRLAVPIGNRLGATGINIASRIMGLILSAIAIEFIAAGIKGLFPGLGA